MSVTLDFCYEIFIFGVCLLCGIFHVSTKHVPQMLCNSLYFWQCQHRSLNSSLGPGVGHLGLWPVSSLPRSIPMLGCFFSAWHAKIWENDMQFWSIFFSGEVHQRSQQWTKPGMLMVAEPGKCHAMSFGNLQSWGSKHRFCSVKWRAEVWRRIIFLVMWMWFLLFWYKNELGNIDFFGESENVGDQFSNFHFAAWKSFIIGMRLQQTGLSSFNEYIATMFRGKLSGPARICSWCMKGHYHVTTFFFLIDLTLLVSADALEILRASLKNWRLELVESLDFCMNDRLHPDETKPKASVFILTFGELLTSVSIMAARKRSRFPESGFQFYPLRLAQTLGTTVDR